MATISIKQFDELLYDCEGLSIRNIEKYVLKTWNIGQISQKQQLYLGLPRAT